MELLTMSRSELDRLAALRRYQGGALTQKEVALQLGLCERQVRRLLRRLEAAGEGGIVSRRRGRPSNNRLDAQLVETALALVSRHYGDFGPTFANEKLRERHGVVLSNESLRRAMMKAGLWQPRKRRQPKLHPPRQRRPCRGELVQIDGSDHRWFETRGPRCVLVDAVDDATSEILAAHFALTESTDAYFALLKNLLKNHGRPLALYSDRHATLTPTRLSVHTERVSQVGRALDELEIELICATSPQAKGRVERAHQTLQRRLLREMRLRNIDTIDAANDYLPEFIADYNRRFAVEPACSNDVLRSTNDFPLDQILVVRHQRIVRKDLTFQIERQVYQLTDVVLPARLRGARVDISFLNGAMTVCRRGQHLTFQALETRPDQGAVVGPAAIAEHLEQHTERNPWKPGPNHPWRRPPYQPFAPRPSDFST
jgi:transposase